MVAFNVVILFQIRRQAIKDLPKLCQDTVGITSKVGDILAQLLILDDPLELQQVNNSLQTIIKVGKEFFILLFTITKIFIFSAFLDGCQGFSYGCIYTNINRR